MIYKSIDGDKWKKTTVKKLNSFCEKCPVMLSVHTGLDKGDDGVFIIHKNTGQKYFFKWNFDLSPMDFIHEIKMFLIPRHYPLLIQEVFEAHKLTADELAEKVEKGTKIEDLTTNELRLAARRLWLIDRVIAWKNIFIIQEVDKDRKPLGNYFRYKYKGLAITFLNDYRNGKFKSLEEAGKEFFDNSMLISEITPVEGDQNGKEDGKEQSDNN